MRVNRLATLHKTHGIEEPDHAVVVEEGQLVLPAHSRHAAHVEDVGLGVVLVAWCPPAYDAVDGFDLVSYDVGSQDDECRPTAVVHRLELLEDVVCRIRYLTQPVVAYANVQRVVVPDTPWDFPCCHIRCLIF